VSFIYFFTYIPSSGFLLKCKITKTKKQTICDHYFFSSAFSKLIFILFSQQRPQGELKGYDQNINLVLNDCVERVYSPDAGVELSPLGLQIVRGDNM
jgi:small nuclear ribonucleoprotein (snRNP)-like protein